MVLAVVPFTMVGMALEFRFYQGAGSSSDEAYAKANTTVLDATSAIRTGTVDALVALHSA